MAKPSWIRAEDGDWYRASEVVAVKTTPHAQGGFSVCVETHRHDNVDVTGPVEHQDTACGHRDTLARLLAGIGGGTVITYDAHRFGTESVD